MHRGCWIALVAVVALGCTHPAPAPRVISNRVGDPADRPGRRFIYRSGPITVDSLKLMLSERFAAQLAEGTFVAEYSDTQDDLLDELRTMGFTDLAELASIIPDDFDQRGGGEFIHEDPANIPGLVRDFLMIHDARRYFGRAWKNRWQTILPPNVSALKSYVSDFSPFYDAAVLTPEEVANAPEPPDPDAPRRLPPPSPDRDFD